MPYRGNQFTVPFFVINSSDHVTKAAGITWTLSDAMLTKDGGAFATAANSVTVLQSGWYALTVTSAEAQAEYVGVSVTASGTRYDPVDFTIRLDPDPSSFYGWPQSLYQGAPFGALGAVVGTLVNVSEITSSAAGGGLHVVFYKADGTTVWGRQTITQSAGFNPIVKLATV